MTNKYMLFENNVTYIEYAPNIYMLFEKLNDM